jgi:hypothetical protein
VALPYLEALWTRFYQRPSDILKPFLTLKPKTLKSFQAGAAALYLSANPYARPSEVRQALLDATLPNTVHNTKPGTGTPTNLLNTHLSSPLVGVQPRTFITSENAKKGVMVSLKAQPTGTVIVTPVVTDSTIGEVQSPQSEC